MNRSFSRIPMCCFSLLILCANAMAQENDCDFFGLSKPTTEPRDFDPEVLDLNGSFKFNLEIKTCDRIYFTTIASKEDIYFSEKSNGIWSTPKIASFSDPNYSDADPFLNKAGDRMYFISDRPTNPKDYELAWNIWYAINEIGDWSRPIPLPAPINSDDADEYFFSISDKGNAFFSSNRSGGEGSFDIYRTTILINDTFSEPKNIGRPISTEKYEFDPYIAPNERFIIFSINENGNSSLYFSLKNKKDMWTEPKSLGHKINTTDQDFAPSLSADGRFIFYSNDGKLKWVSTAILGVSNIR